MLSRVEEAALRAVGVKSQVEIEGEGPVEKGRREWLKLYQEAHSISDAAELSGLSSKEIFNHIRSRKLVFISGPEFRFRLPAFQFYGDGLVPGIAEVNKCIPLGVKVQDVWGFFDTPQPDLEDDSGEPMRPIDWLREGRKPLQAAVLARFL